MLKEPKGKIKQILTVAAAALILAGALFFIFRGSGGEANITIEAELDKTTYTPDEPINLTLHLNNTGSADTCVSDMAGETLVFNSVTKDGEAVETRTVDANYIAPLPMLLEASLSPLPAGEDMHVTLSSEHDPGLGARALTATELDGDTGFVTFYSTSEPGEYTLELAYQYPGPEAEKCDSVFNGPSNSVELNFTVTGE